MECPYQVESSLSKKPTKTHGYKWNINDAIKRAQDSKNPQGKFGSKTDADFAVQEGQKLQIGERKVIPANEGNSNILIHPDGTTTPATHIFVEVKPAGKTGTVHSFPVPENYPVTPRAGF